MELCKGVTTASTPNYPLRSSTSRSSRSGRINLNPQRQDLEPYHHGSRPRWAVLHCCCYKFLFLEVTAGVCTWKDYQVQCKTCGTHGERGPFRILEHAYSSNFESTCYSSDNVNVEGATFLQKMIKVSSTLGWLVCVSCSGKLACPWDNHGGLPSNPFCVAAEEEHSAFFHFSTHLQNSAPPPP